MANQTGSAPANGGARRGPKPGARAPKDETKAQKFARLAPGRVDKALTALAGIGKLGTRSQYEYTEAQVKAIVDALTNGVISVKNAFNPQAVKASSGFRLPDATEGEGEGNSPGK